MTQAYEDVQGMDFTLPNAPPLTSPPLSLLGESRYLINIEGMVNRKQQLVEMSASAAEHLENYDRVGEFDIPGDADSAADAIKALEQQMSEWDNELDTLDTQLKILQQWEHGFVFLPELSNAGSMSVFTEDEFPAISNPTQGALKPTGPNQNQFGWYDPFLAVALDSRSLFGWPLTDMASRVQRAVRSLLAHEAWQCEREFWSGAKVPTNVHLTAGPGSATSSPHRTLRTAFALPTPCPGTVLGTSESLSDSLASLDQAIADADAGTGMIHAAPYVVQKWSQVYPFLRDTQGNIRTVNNNLLVPGYGYPGTGPDQVSRTVTDGVLNSTTALTSATAVFTNFDLGMPVTATGIPPNTYIVTVTSATAVVLSNAATATATAVHVTLPGTGGDNTGNDIQWAYATDFVYHLQGDVMTYPLDLREMSPDTVSYNLAEVRAERSHALITNGLLRAAVLVDTTTL